MRGGAGLQGEGAGTFLHPLTCPSEVICKCCKSACVSIDLLSLAACCLVSDNVMILLRIVAFKFSISPVFVNE